MFNTLCYIGEKLNSSNIVWGVGASVLLSQFGLIEKPNDIDIFIAIMDIKKADEILKSIGQKKKWEKAATYSTKYFYEYIVNGIDLDVMAGFAVNHDSGVFKYIFDNNSISDFETINGVNIPFTSLEDWYVIYQLIPGRESKVKLIEDYLLANGIKNPILLKRALEGSLPVEVRGKIEHMLISNEIINTNEVERKMNRMNIICLGVRDMERSIRFYRDGLGFKTDEKRNNPEVIFFSTSGTKLELYPIKLLAMDIDEKNPPEISRGFAGITLAYNAKSREEVHEVIELARNSGARIVKEPQEVFWGGYHAYFSDPDGYYWEVAWGPNFAFDENGMLKL